MSSQIPASERDALLSPTRGGQETRSPASKSYGFGARSMPLSSGAPPGSFNPDLKSTFTANGVFNRPKLESHPSYRSEEGDDKDDKTLSEKRQTELRDQIEREMKIKLGSENMLEALNTKSAKQTKEQRMRVESELNASNFKITQLKLGLEAEIQRSKESPPSPAGKLTQLFQNAPTRSPSRFAHNSEDQFSESETESPTFVLAEILQSLEASGMPSEYYVKHANDLVELFKRHPTLKYDLAWSIFGLRVQMMLLSDSDEVVAAGYRVMRYAITDRKSIQTMCSLHIDYLVMLSLVKGSKATVEREQALKFTRAFLDVKDGVEEIPKPVLRVIVAVAEHTDDRLRGMCILTLAEIFIRNPTILVSAGGLGLLVDVLGEGTHHTATTLVGTFAYILDTPGRRACIDTGNELTGAFVSFTEGPFRINEDKLRANAKVIIGLLKTWPGLMTLALHNFIAIRSLTASLGVQVSQVRDIILDILFDVLDIKHPSWSSSFLAGRRLTTYGRVTNLNDDSRVPSGDNDPGRSQRDLIDHFTSIVLAVFLHTGLIDSLAHAIEDESEASVKKKATLLLGEILHMASNRLPSSWAPHLQILPGLFSSASTLGSESRFMASGAIYQIDSINRILARSGQSKQSPMVLNGAADFQYERPRVGEPSKTPVSYNMDEGQFRAMLLETQVLNTVNFIKWRWDLIQKLIEGPLLNSKRLDEATRATKFLKRLLGFLRPFKYRFSNIQKTKPNQRYVRAGCALLRTLLQTNEGIKYLADNKLLPQIAECLAQVDRTSGLTSSSPLFSEKRLSETLTGGYFALLGVVSGNPKGLQMMERWKMANMIYHIVELQDRDDLLKSLLGNMDYTLDSHLRIILSKAMTSCSKDIRIFSTRLLRKHAIKKAFGSSPSEADTGNVEWAIQLLITQLYDPEVEVCEAAVKILEEACDDVNALEYVVQCRPALDHLGEIGAPLLLRFLSTSLGYRYLDGLDYISQEMDDWFLGRNDSYVTLVEASLAKAFEGNHGKPRPSADEEADNTRYGVTPPHFYRELARTADGCRLLQGKGHFEEFVATIRSQGMENEDSEAMLKVKGCLWAVGNVGSMELGASFLESTNVVKLIIDIAEKSEVMTMRGTALFVLGLISKSLHGQEILAEHDWDVSVDDMGNSLGICIPSDIRSVFSMSLQKRTEDVILSRPDMPTITRLDTDSESKRIVSLVKDLGNTVPVLAKRSVSELKSLKAKKAPAFQDPQMFEQIMCVLEQHHFRLPILHFVYDLFDKDVMKRIVLEEDLSPTV